MGIFPDPRTASPEGIVAIGGKLNTKTLMEAYKSGIFPWPQAGYPMLWFSPDPRGVLDFTDFHIPSSLKKLARKQNHWRYTINQATDQVIDACAQQKRKGQPGTWIMPELAAAYKEMAKKGHILSVEVWSDSELIGGVYGVFFRSKKQRFFSGESMFHKETGASKLALCKLVEYLDSKGLSWIDTQMVTKVIELMGGKLIARQDFLKRLGV